MPETGPRADGWRSHSTEISPQFIDLVMEMVRSIPPGRVMTYGDIAYVLTFRAERAGRTEAYGPRMVGFVMSRMGSDLPWWRVIRATGLPPQSLQYEALPHYLDEETPLVGPEENYRIDMKVARFDPDESLEWVDRPPE